MTNATTIYRFKISNEELYEHMIDFAKTNRFLDKQDLVDEYEKWIETPDIAMLVSEEENLLMRHSYDLNKTNIRLKIFKSIKYYHIKKLLKDVELKECVEKSDKKKGKSRVKFSDTIIGLVKQELELHKGGAKPSVCYESFKKKYCDELNVEKDRIGLGDDSDFEFRLKKMFKNQCFHIFKS